MAEQHSSEARLTRCVMSRDGKPSKGLTSDMVGGISIHESIEPVSYTHLTLPTICSV